jgi:hypothetical protein
MRAREKKDQESKRQRDEFFNKLWPMVPRQQWRAKPVSGATNADVPVETEVNRSDQLATPVGPVIEGSTQDRLDRSMEFQCK